MEIEDPEYKELLEEVKYTIKEIDPSNTETSIYNIKEILIKLVDILETQVESKDQVEQEIEESENPQS